jgi:hypothetical protein
MAPNIIMNPLKKHPTTMNNNQMDKDPPVIHSNHLIQNHYHHRYHTPKDGEDTTYLGREDPLTHGPQYTYTG